MNIRYSATSAHLEVALEQHLVDQLVEQQGYLRREPHDYDRASALDRELVLQFVRQTQPDEWTKLEQHYTTSAEPEFFKQLENALKSRSTLEVLRHGIKIIPNIKFALCYLRPASGLNQTLIDLYQSNILSVIRQVRYSSKHDNELDVVLFINGIPVVTAELKNLLTGSTFRHAERQYRTDRSPNGEPLLTFKRGALVHFAIDEDNVSMTTRLKNGATTFLPFNRGRDGGAGNPDIPGEFRIAYLYADQPDGKAILSREILLDIIGKFIHLEREDGRETMIFPRYQQLDAVRKLMNHARTYGPGQNYLVQHSTGSGKSNTIGWAAHQAINLHDEQDRPVFNTAIIVTDRVVLDRQLQRTISQFEQTAGVVRKIDGTSRQLKAAIESGARIIVSTIQKFSTDHLAAISGQGSRTFAVIIDEAHSSQSGKSNTALTQALTREATSSDDIEDLIAEYQEQRGPQSNISFFAFTATPRNVTLERFGVAGDDGLPLPFHLYSMRQAIEEGFILDVLQNYMTYKAYYQLEKAVEDDPELNTRHGQRKVARFASLHPTAITQKVGVMIEHFKRHVRPILGDQSKAMIVTQSREHALRYYKNVRKCLEADGYSGLKALVAISGELTIDGETYTEADLNEFSERQLPEKFDTDEFQILIVAEKYQTGFDQPKLCAMYVDKKLSGLQAVQTLSRLNRTYPGKDMTFVLDFQNTIEEIQEAFQPYYEGTELEARSDPNQIYQLQHEIMAAGYLDRGEIEEFAQTFYQGEMTANERARLQGLVMQAKERFAQDDEDDRKENFRQLLRSYMRFYAFVAQVISLGDTDLEKLYAYVAWLSKLLPSREIPPEIEITEDMLRLQAFKVVEKESGSATPAICEAQPLKPIYEFGASSYTEEEAKSLSEIIEAFNDRHGTEFTEEDFLQFESVNAEILTEELIAVLRKNPPDVAYPTFEHEFFQGVIRKFQRDAQMKSIVLSDQQAREQAIQHFFNRAIRQVREEQSA